MRAYQTGEKDFLKHPQLPRWQQGIIRRVGGKPKDSLAGHHHDGVFPVNLEMPVHAEHHAGPSQNNCGKK
jgi:hypothetical protein